MIDQNSQFQAILTAIGEAKQANADALGVPWTFAQMAVGDANGTDPFPDRLQTKLINERRRAPLNQLKPDPKNPGIIIAEQVIPENVGGFWIREIGLYDTDGDLVAVANCAPTFKPLLTQGSGRTQIIRMNLIVSSLANIVLKIDPSVVLATRDYVDRSIGDVLPADKVPGTYHQVTINARGIVVSGSNPTTLDGFGINNAYTKDQTNDLLEQRVAADSILAAGVVNGDPNSPYFRFKKPDGSTGHIINLSLSSHGHTFDSLSNKPTTRDGYDLRDVLTAGETRQRYVANGANNLLSLVWKDEGLTAKVDAVELGNLWYSTNFNPADKADKSNTYTIGQTDVRLSQRIVSDWISHAGLVSDNPDLPYFIQTSTGNILQLARKVHRHAFSDLDGLPDTAVGHGIYDVYSVSQSDVKFNQKLTRDAISVAGLWGGDINLPYFRRAFDEQPVYFITQTTLPKNTCQKGIPGWWKCADTGLLRQRVSIYIGDVSTAWAGAVRWPAAFAEQADSVKLSFLHTNGSPATVSCAYADLTTTGCNLRVDEWGINPQYGLTLIVEAEGY
ncbi:phage tail protein [Pseudomonas gessardii]|uniref:phage tail protein n=1 Tax=Pseudomonas gessardii TaxID=78544 RepID=UPI0018D7FBC5|nr:phage tail protein [Pseudomonas gessardii]MBH3422859.1 phage tail protein [Pseudomonas gessardii]